MNAIEPTLVAKVLEVHRSLRKAAVEHAFGGALALAYYTNHPRATADIDVNIAASPQTSETLFSALPDGVVWTQDEVDQSLRDEQVRLWWGRTPLDLFFRASRFHDEVNERTVWHPFADTTLPFLAAADLAAFKALFNRPKDWLDISEMVHSHAIAPDQIAATLQGLLGDDPRVDRMRSLDAGD